LKISGKNLDHDSVCRMPHSHGSSWQKPGKQDHRGDPALQCEFKEQVEKKEKMNRQPVFFMKMR